ncbi:winged helix-turn-helix domain-containing protein [Novosphingobium mathurense]|nr:winged helix-turn-helix domain-containing protein [Novosphingobium mathurense]
MNEPIAAEPRPPGSMQLAHREDFRLGRALVRPSLRTVEGPLATLTAEPRVMQVLMALADVRGAVLSRADLLEVCWAGRIVGDDAVNRVIGELRRIARETGAGFVVETIPRIGFRLVGEIESVPVQPAVEASPGDVDVRPGLDRRTWLAGGLTVLAAASGSTWWMAEGSGNRSAARQIAEGRRILRELWPDQDERGVEVLREAVKIEPGNAKAWGLLAMAWRNVAEGAPPDRVSAAVTGCEEAARRALALDANEGNALAALATLRPYLGDWEAAEDRMRRVLEVAPDNPNVLLHLVTLLQSVGHARASWDLNERAIAKEPLSPPHQFRKALKYWIFGDIAEADLTIDRAMQLWPKYPAIWSARLYIFAFTGRTQAALTLLKDRSLRPAMFTSQLEERWQVALTALEAPTAGNLAQVRRALADEARPGFAVQAVMFLSALGDLDAAFAVAQGFLLRKGPLVGSIWPAQNQMISPDDRWRRTMNLFTPATMAMRADPRFAPLCEGIGLTRYWQARGAGPDAFLMPDQKLSSMPSPSSRGSPAVASPEMTENL